MFINEPSHLLLFFSLVLMHEYSWVSYAGRLKDAFSNSGLPWWLRG